MRICISSTGSEKISLVDIRFGRCSYFAIYDTETNEFKVIQNEATVSSQGAGIAAAQQVIDEKIDVVITGNLGPNAMKLLNTSGIEGYSVKGRTVEEAMNLFLDRKLSIIDKAAPAHSGM